MYLNKAFVYGNLTRDPEVRALPTGAQVTSFAVATTRSWKNKDGQKQEDTQYHNCVAFGPLAKIIGQYLKKGRGIFVEGRIQTRSWDAQDGTKKYRTEIVVENFQFGPGGPAGSGPASGNSAPVTAEAPQSAPAEQLDTIQYPEEDINPDDIPF
ncbi:MAG: single-stranded DNA-binding protein [Patescibacteria group bacterium]